MMKILQRFCLIALCGVHAINAVVEFAMGDVEGFFISASLAILFARIDELRQHAALGIFPLS